MTRRRSRRNEETSRQTIDGQLDAMLAFLQEDSPAYASAVELGYDIAVAIESIPDINVGSAIRLCELLECIPERYRQHDLEATLAVIAIHHGNIWDESGWIEITRADLRQINLGGNTYVDDEQATQILRFIYRVDLPLTSPFGISRRTQSAQDVLTSIAQVLDVHYGPRAPSAVQALVLNSGIALGDYVNLGETYAATVFHLTRATAEMLSSRVEVADSRWIVHAWGDLVEKWEQRRTSFERAGTVSHGTLLTNDLVEAFADELEAMVVDLAGQGGEGTQDLLRDARDWLATTAENAPLLFRAVDWEATRREQGDELVVALMDDLNEYAPDGFYFGAHPGDGSDFGWWPVEDDEY